VAVIVALPLPSKLAEPVTSPDRAIVRAVCNLVAVPALPVTPIPQVPDAPLPVVVGAPTSAAL